MRPSDVTLAVPVFNGEEQIGETLESILALQSEPARIICIDDDSTDRTTEVVRSYENVELIERNENGGVAAARNTALKNTDTPGLAMIDADVTVPPSWLDQVVEEVNSTNADVVTCKTIEEVSNIADQWREQHASVTMYYDVVTNEVIATANVLFRTEILRAIGGWNERFVRAYDDADLCQRLLDKGFTIRHLPEPECRHRKTSDWKTVVRTLYYYRKPHTPSSLDVTTTKGFILRTGGHGMSLLKCVAKDIASGTPELIPLSLLTFPQSVYLDIKKRRELNERVETERSSQSTRHA